MGKVNSEESFKAWNYASSPGVYVRWVGTDGGAEAGATLIKETLRRKLSGHHGPVANECKLLRDRLALGCELIRGEGPIDAPHIKKKGN